MQTYMQRCRLIKTTTGHNKCAPPLVMIHRHQRQRRHKPTSTATITTSTVAVYLVGIIANVHVIIVVGTYNKGGDICQLLTACQAKRANCQHHWSKRKFFTQTLASQFLRLF